MNDAMKLKAIEVLEHKRLAIAKAVTANAKAAKAYREEHNIAHPKSI